MSANESSYVSVSPGVTVVDTILVALITLTGMIGNSVLLAAYYLHKDLQTPSNALVVNIAISDLIMCCVVHPFILMSIIGRGSVTLSDTTCFAIGTIMVITYGVSLWGQVTIAINRFIRVCFHTKYDKIYTFRNNTISIIVLWLCCITITYGGAAMNTCTYHYDPRQFECTYASRGDTKCAGMLITGILLPSVITFLLYSRIFCVIRRSTSRLSSHAEARPRESTTSGNSNKHAKKRESRDRRAVMTLFTAFLMLVLLFYPYAIVIIVDSNASSGTLDRTIRYLAWFASISTCTNPIVYGLMNSKFKIAYSDIFWSLRHCKRESSDGKHTLRRGSKFYVPRSSNTAT
ncbi:melatonin receptor type 1A-like [Tubulanus polymorphus]|uniref:melatonin receptor type 1A-like n=1 Tax=Tubulanus polymorphus TaxID=672921 RepID=UPI003DA3DDA8